MPAPKLTESIILAAIEGFESQKTKLDQQIVELRSMLSGVPAETAATPQSVPGKRRKFSAAARRRMKEAQQRRWAAAKGTSEATAPATPEPATPEAPKPKRKISAEGMKNIIAATKKRWKRQRAAEKAQSAPLKKASTKAAAKKVAVKKAAKKATKTSVVAPAVAQAAS